MTHVVIIGAYGSAGVKVATELAEASDVTLTLIDHGDPGGGLCILRGCMPSKEVLSAGAHRYRARVDARLAGESMVDLESVIATKDDHTESFASHRRAAVQDLADRPDVEFIHDTAQFVDERTVAVGERTLDADYVVIATGSTPTVPDLPGRETVEVMTSDDVLETTTFEESGVMIGFGYIGVELAPYLTEVANLDLTVIDRNETPLGDADPAFGDRLLDLYEEEFGIEVLTNAEAQSLEETDDGVRVAYDQGGATDTVAGDHLFMFTGRRPSTAGLGLERAGIEAEPGWVQDTMQTVDDPRVFAAGDVNGRHPLLHVAKKQGRVTAENILAHREDRSLTRFEPRTHRVVFSGLGVYPFAQLGLTAAEARAAGADPLTVAREPQDDGVFITKDAARGLAHLIVDSTDGRILGYQGLHYHADVMAKTVQVILDQELDVWDVPDRAYHPTTPELLDGLLRDAKARLTD